MKSSLLTIFLFAIGTALAQENNSTFEVAGRTFEVPSSWKSEKPSSSMRKAQYRVGKAEVVVFYFGADRGGGVEANVARWFSQFKEPREKLSAKSETKEIKESKITTVSAKGTYMSGPPFGEKVPKPGYALRGAIVECKGGPLFIKMTGPEKDVTASSEAFDKAVRSGL